MTMFHRLALKLKLFWYLYVKVCLYHYPKPKTWAKLAMEERRIYEE